MSLERHSFRLLSAHRCRWCASPLSRDHVCERCHRKQWTEELKKFYVKQTDLRGAILLIAGLLGFLFPIGGLVLTLILFRPLVVRPLAVHLNSSTRFLVALVMMFLKLLLLVPMLFLAMVPGIGILVLVPFALRYLYTRNQFLSALKLRSNGELRGDAAAQNKWSDEQNSGTSKPAVVTVQPNRP